MKSYVRNTINLSCAKILLTSVISNCYCLRSLSIDSFDVRKLNIMRCKHYIHILNLRHNIYKDIYFSYLQLFSAQGYRVPTYVICWLQLIAVNCSSVNSSILIALWSEYGEHVLVLLLYSVFGEVHRQLRVTFLNYLCYMRFKSFYFKCLKVPENWSSFCPSKLAASSPFSVEQLQTRRSKSDSL